MQLRTIAMDCWASLEHQLKYKKDTPFTEEMMQELSVYIADVAMEDVIRITEVMCDKLSFGLSCHIGPGGLGIAVSKCRNHNW